jgi:hypothetical protein
MKTKLILVALVVFLMTTGFECLNDPIVVAISIDPVSACYTVRAGGNGTFGGSAVSYNLQQLIPADYRDQLLGFRIYDVRIRLVGPYPTGAVSGTGYAQFNSEPELTVLTFAGQYSQFANGVSLLNSGGLVLPGSGFNAFIARVLTLNSNLSSIATTTIKVRAQGSGPVPTSDFSVCIDIYFQADADVNNS